MPVGSRPSPAMLVALAALFVALGGTGYAITAIDKNSVTTREVKNRSLIKKDFKKGQLPRGAKGAAGRAGAVGAPGDAGPAGATGETGAAGTPGATGATGTVDTSNFFTKTESDGRFLPLAGTAANASQLGGIAASGYMRGLGGFRPGSRFIAAGTTHGFITNIATMGFLRGSCGAGGGSTGHDFQTADNRSAGVRTDSDAGETDVSVGPGAATGEFTTTDMVDHVQYAMSSAGDIAMVDIWARRLPPDGCLFDLYIYEFVS